ncbi:MAG: hypothetical protein IKF29_09580, partial [Oceanobacillus sp.]|nr:hypothetical protein [Oceanobacillus sp.]
NHDQIEKVVYKGYETDNQKEISKVLNGGLAEREKRLAELAEQENASTPVIPLAEDKPAE